MKPFGLKNKAGWKDREREREREREEKIDQRQKTRDKKKNRKAVARKHYPPHLVINLLK